MFRDEWHGYAGARYWGETARPAEDAANMRDDISALSALRMFPEPTRAPAVQRLPVLPATSTFEAQLARAAKARVTLNANKRYVSPLKQSSNARLSPNANRPKPAATTANSAFSTVRRPNTLTPNRAAATRPLLPAQRPEAPRAPAPASPSAPMALADYPHPNGDNGRGMHWIPTTKQSNAVVDRFVAEAQKMGVKWVTFLNDGATIGQNDYLVSKLVGAGIEPIMRLYSPALEPIPGDIEAMVRHYVGMGVHYFQPFNEPNLSVEQPDGVPSVDRYLDAWIPAARAIVRGGGLPGFGSLAPGGDENDLDFLQQALDKLKARGQVGLLDRGWLSMHNYTHNHPIQERADSDGFFKFRAYHRILQDALGRDVPIIGTEGGTFVGEHEDPSMPAVDAATAVNMATQAYSYMRNQREPWNFAYSFWAIANDAGGGTDSRFNAQALFDRNGTPNAVAAALEGLG
jgi:hypothetical protein